MGREITHETDAVAVAPRHRFSFSLAGMIRQRRVQVALALPLLALAVLLAPFATQAIRTRTAHFEGQVFDPATPPQDFTLTDQHGAPWQLSGQHGKAVLLYFGYTNCPDICPATMVLFQDVVKQLGSDANRVRFVFITIDPDHDTPVQLGNYLTAFDPTFVGLTGALAQLEPVYQSFGTYRTQTPATHTGDDHKFTHPTNIFGIDPHGRLRIVHDYGDPTESFTHDIRLLLRY